MDPETGRIKLGWELFAGGAAGGCQVVCAGLALCYCANPKQVFTNPLEIVYAFQIGPLHNC